MNENYISSKLKESLAEMQELMLKIHSLTEEQFQTCLTLLQEKTRSWDELDLAIASREVEINLTEREMQNKAISTLLLHSPVGYEFRFSSSIIYIALDYERMGDELEHIYESFVLNLKSNFFYKEYNNLLLDIIKTCQDSQFSLIKAFMEEDIPVIRKIIENDAIINNLVDQGKNLLLKYESDDTDNEYVRLHLIDCYVALRSLERYGDHIKNIGQQFIYIFTGVDSKAIEVAEKQSL